MIEPSKVERVKRGYPFHKNRMNLTGTSTSVRCFSQEE